jgi:hypothetical protein
MKTLIWLNAIAWCLLFANNLVRLILALFDHKSPELTAIALFAVPLIAALIPFWFRRHEKRGDAAIAAALLLLVWIPATIYCLQFWIPGQGG